MNVDYQITQLMPPAADWFCVSMIYESEKTRVFIDRVIMWALLKGPKCIERVSGIDNSGVPFPAQFSEAVSGDMFYVLGADLSPAGKSWSTLYNSITPSNVLVREIVDSEILRSFAQAPAPGSKPDWKQFGGLN